MFKNRIPFSLFLVLLFTVFSCKKEVLPKPSGYLRLDYPEAKYVPFENKCPYTFEINSEAIIKGTKDCGFAITYPKMKATIYIIIYWFIGNVNRSFHLWI